MKHNFFFMLVIVSILASLIGTAAAPMPAPVPVSASAKIERVTLAQATFMEEKGMIFMFSVDGTFTEKELKGSLLVKGKTIKLRCRYNERTDLVQCTAPGGTATKYAGKTALVSLNGFYFWVTVPSKKECPTCG